MLDRALGETGAKAVILLAPFGIQQNWTEELAICRRRGVALVIDNAAGLGGPRSSQGFGEEVFEIFSMHATKPFAVGEGGAIFAHRSHDAALRSALNFALDSHTNPAGPAWGFNGKMSEFHAAIAIVQLTRIRSAVVRRQSFAAIYRDRLVAYPELVFPNDVECAPWQFFPVLLPSAEAAERLIKAAAAAGVELRRYYRQSLSLWPNTQCFETCPVAEDLGDRMCVLPVRSVASDDEVGQIVTLILGALNQSLTTAGG